MPGGVKECMNELCPPLGVDAWRWLIGLPGALTVCPTSVLSPGGSGVAGVWFPITAP